MSTSHYKKAIASTVLIQCLALAGILTSSAFAQTAAVPSSSTASAWDAHNRSTNASSQKSVNILVNTTVSQPTTTVDTSTLFVEGARPVIQSTTPSAGRVVTPEQLKQIQNFFASNPTPGEQANMARALGLSPADMTQAQVLAMGYTPSAQQMQQMFQNNSDLLGVNNSLSAAHSQQGSVYSPTEHRAVTGAEIRNFLETNPSTNEVLAKAASLGLTMQDINSILNNQGLLSTNGDIRNLQMNDSAYGSIANRFNTSLSYGVNGYTTADPSDINSAIVAGNGTRYDPNFTAPEVRWALPAENTATGSRFDFNTATHDGTMPTDAQIRAFFAQNPTLGEQGEMARALGLSPAQMVQAQIKGMGYAPSNMQMQQMFQQNSDLLGINNSLSTTHAQAGSVYSPTTGREITGQEIRAFLETKPTTAQFLSKAAELGLGMGEIGSILNNQGLLSTNGNMTNLQTNDSAFGSLFNRFHTSLSYGLDGYTTANPSDINSPIVRGTGPRSDSTFKAPEVVWNLPSAASTPRADAIQEFYLANKNNPAAIVQAMTQNGVTASEAAAATGTPASTFEAMARTSAIQDFYNANKNNSGAIAEAMSKNGVTPQEAATATGQSASNFTPEALRAGAIREFYNANQNNPAAIQQAMTKNGVSAQEAAAATGKPISTFQPAPAVSVVPAPVAPSRADAIREFYNANRNNPAVIQQAMIQNGVTAAEAAAATGMPTSTFEGFQGYN